MTNHEIKIEQVPAEKIPSLDTLMEIKDSRLLACINQAVPELFQAGNAAGTAFKTAQAATKTVYSAKLPAGYSLDISKQMEGAFRGTYHGANGRIAGQANWVMEDATNGISAGANAVSSVMNIAALVVGQYYMSQINSKLDEISSELNDISSFLDAEYKSRILSLVIHVKNISAFQNEILENPEQRRIKLNLLENLSVECAQLLGQVILTLGKKVNNKNWKNFEEYEKQTEENDSWFMSQQILFDLLNEISQLKFTLYLGKASRQECSGVLNNYAKQVRASRKALWNWHDAAIKQFTISRRRVSRKKQGLEMLGSFIPGQFDKEKLYTDIDKKTTNRIQHQMKPAPLEISQDDLYSKDVQLFSQNGKLYYLPEI